MAKLNDVVWLNGKHIHTCRTYMRKISEKAYLVGISAVYFFLPFVFLVALYALISKQLITDKYISQKTSERSCTHIKTRRQVVIMLLAVVVLFFVCLAPHVFFRLWLTFTKPDTLKSFGRERLQNLLNFTRIMLYLNSTVNPIVYNMMSSKFRISFRRALHCRISKQYRKMYTFSKPSNHDRENAIRQAVNSKPLHQATVPEKSLENYTRLQLFQLQSKSNSPMIVFQDVEL